MNPNSTSSTTTTTTRQEGRAQAKGHACKGMHVCMHVNGTSCMVMSPKCFMWEAMPHNGINEPHTYAWPCREASMVGVGKLLSWQNSSRQPLPPPPPLTTLTHKATHYHHHHHSTPPPPPTCLQSSHYMVMVWLYRHPRSMGVGCGGREGKGRWKVGKCVWSFLRQTFEMMR